MAVSIGAGWSIGPGWSAGGDSGGGGGGTYATGGTVIDISGYRVHVFNSSDTFATTSSWPSGLTLEYLVVAGGGGSDNAGGGGGGAGGLLTASGVTGVASTNYAVTIGAGGSTDSNGGNSSLIGGAISATSIGGGGANGVSGDAFAGGSGGGGGSTGDGTNYAGGAGTAGQGNAGADSAGKFNNTATGGGGGAGAAGGNSFGGDGLVSTMITAYSASTITIPEFSQSWNLYTFTVSAGLPFQANSAVYVSNNATPSISLMGRVDSYSGTTMVCQLDRYDNGGGTPTLSGWNISFAHAGGGVGSDQGSTNSPASLGGGGGQYGDTFPDDFYNGLPNSGGGASLYATQTGGSGVVMIKYAYP